MKEEEFWSCKFIEDGLKFYTLDEVVEDILIIREIYNDLTTNQKYLYRWYVYAHPNLTMNAKNMIWDFLNGDCDYPLFLLRQKQVRK